MSAAIELQCYFKGWVENFPLNLSIPTKAANDNYMRSDAYFF